MTTSTKTRKRTTDAPAGFDLSVLREVPTFIWREIDRPGLDPLRVKVQVLSIRQTNAIPWGEATPMADIYAVIAPYVVEWDLRAENIESGELVDVPSPAVIGAEVFELLPTSVAVSIAMWLKYPAAMLRAEAVAATSDGQSSETPTTDTDARG